VTLAIHARRLVTADAARAADGDRLGVLEDAALVVDGARIAWIGPRAACPRAERTIVHDGVVTPGLVDAHTHAAWTGSRHAEYAVRMAGGDYRAIAAAGGGIVATQRAVEAASPEALADELHARVLRMARLGVTTVEVKSGYGLLPPLELRQLEAIAAVTGRAAPRLVPTYLALHAVPAARATERADYVREQIALTEEIARRGLARFVDAYVDAHAFTTDEARALGAAARAAGLGVRLHVGQFADVGGAELAAELGAASVDHLEHVGEAGIAALARAGVAAVLLPVASFTLGQAPPPVAALRAAGVRIVVASDANPGTAPTESLPLALAFAVRSYGLSPEEALLGATREAAATLASDATGMLRAGDPADLVLWDLPHETSLVQPWGDARTRLVVAAGRTLFEA
jgi:imidazolonepropionase